MVRDKDELNMWPFISQNRFHAEHFALPTNDPIRILLRQEQFASILRLPSDTISSTGYFIANFIGKVKIKCKEPSMYFTDGVIQSCICLYLTLLNTFSIWTPCTNPTRILFPQCYILSHLHVCGLIGLVWTFNKIYLFQNPSGNYFMSFALLAAHIIKKNK